MADIGFDIRYTSTANGTKVKVKPKLHFNIFRRDKKADKAL